MRRRIVALALGMLVLFLPACGGSVATPEAEAPPEPTAIPQPTAPLKTYGLNQLVQIQGWDLAIQRVDRIGPRLAWSQFSNTVPATGTWVVIVVDVKNTGAQPSAITAEMLSLRSGSTVYPMAEATQVAGYGEQRRGWRLGEPIPPGKSVSIYTVYDLPPDAKGLLLTVKQDTQPVFAVGDVTR